MSPNEHKYSKILRWFGALLGTIVAVFSIYKLSLVLSNLGLEPKDRNTDLHGFVGVLFGVGISPIAVIIFNSLLNAKQPTGEPRPILKVSRTSASVDEVFQAPSEPGRGISLRGALLALTISWLVSLAYCQFLYSTVDSALTDKSVIGVDVSELDAAKILNTIRGTLIYGSFIPLSAASALLCGWLCKSTITYRAMTIPSFLLYGILNLVSLYHSGETSIMHGIRHFIAALQEGPQVVPDNLAMNFIVYLAAILVFSAVVLLLAFYGWAWTKVGARLRNKV